MSDELVRRRARALEAAPGDPEALARWWADRLRHDEPCGHQLVRRVDVPVEAIDRENGSLLARGPGFGWVRLGSGGTCTCPGAGRLWLGRAKLAAFAGCQVAASAAAHAEGRELPVACTEPLPIFVRALLAWGKEACVRAGWAAGMSVVWMHESPGIVSLPGDDIVSFERQRSDARRVLDLVSCWLVDDSITNQRADMELRALTDGRQARAVREILEAPAAWGGIEAVSRGVLEALDSWSGPQYELTMPAWSWCVGRACLSTPSAAALLAAEAAIWAVRDYATEQHVRSAIQQELRRWATGGRSAPGGAV